MCVKLLTEHHLECLSLKRGYIGLFEQTLVKMPHCWKSHVMAQISVYRAIIGLHYLESVANAERCPNFYPPIFLEQPFK